MMPVDPEEGPVVIPPSCERNKGAPFQQKQIPVPSSTQRVISLIPVAEA
jgi:hypothetical protein